MNDSTLIASKNHFDLICDVVTHTETGRIDVDDKLTLILALRPLLSGVAMPPEQASIWNKYAVKE